MVTISNSAPDGVLLLDTIKESMFNEELRRKEMGVDNSQALVVKNRGRVKGKGSRGAVIQEERLSQERAKRPGHVSTAINPVTLRKIATSSRENRGKIKIHKSREMTILLRQLLLIAMMMVFL